MVFVRPALLAEGDKLRTDAILSDLAVPYKTVFVSWQIRHEVAHKNICFFLLLSLGGPVEIEKVHAVYINCSGTCMADGIVEPCKA